MSVSDGFDGVLRECQRPTGANECQTIAPSWSWPCPRRNVARCVRRAGKFPFVVLLVVGVGCVPSSEPQHSENQPPANPSVATTGVTPAPAAPMPAAPAPVVPATEQVTRVAPSPAANRPSGPGRSRSRGQRKEPPPDSAPGSSPEKLKQGVLERADAARMVVSELQKSTSYAPTLVVWLVDRSASCREMVADFGRLTRALVGDLPAGGSGDEAKLLTAVVTFGSDVQFVVDPPSADPAAICSAIEGLPADESGKEVTFAAIKEATTKFLPYRTEKQREVLFILVTDEAGDDAELVDQVIDAPRRAGIPFYVVGVPAPFGKDAALTPQVEAGLDYKPSGNWLAIRQGPESRYSEKMRLGYWGGSTELDVMDSGFGQFALEWLCRATGGRYLALRPDASEFAFVSALNMQWPSPGGPRFDPEIMRRYAPNYVSAADYQALLAGNKARHALHEAAKLSDVELSEFPQTVFNKADEPTMVRVLSQAQQVAAKLEPMANRWYEVLEKGEADRAKVTEPRWQAGFDLALGRAAAVKAKVDGYNSMLATLKRGKSFQNPASTAWVLEPADSVEGASALQKLIDKSKTYLTRVATQHAGTPWAKLAEKELQIPCGWKWTER